MDEFLGSLKTAHRVIIVDIIQLAGSESLDLPGFRAW